MTISSSKVSLTRYLRSSVAAADPDAARFTWEPGDITITDAPAPSEADQLSVAWHAAVTRAAPMVNELQAAYEVTLEQLAKQAAAKFKKHAGRIVSITAAGEMPKFTLPSEEEIYDLVLAEMKLRGATAPVRTRIAQTIVGDVAASLNLRFDLNNPMVKGVLEQMGRNITQIVESQRAQIMKVAQDAYDNHLSIEHAAQQIATRGGIDSIVRARRIARTEFIGAANGGSHAAASASGVKYKQWVATNDDRVRPDHADADGQVVPMDQPFQVGGTPMMYPGDPNGPADEVINCFPGDTEVVASHVRAATRHWYEGPLIEVHTQSGMQFSATPNHPILTLRGWQPVQALRDGDQLVRPSFAERVGLGDPQIGNLPTPLAEIYDAALDLGTVERVGRGRVDFHGDVPQSEVEVVRPDRQLGDRSHEVGFDQQLVGLAQGESSAARGEDGSFGRIGVARTDLPGFADCVGHFGGQSATLLEAHLAEPEVPGVGLATWFDTSLEQATADDAATDAIRLGEAVFAFSGEIATDNVVDVHAVPFAGWVYNLETRAGFYHIGNGAVSKNCRCTIVYSDSQEGSQTPVAGLFGPGSPFAPGGWNPNLSLVSPNLPSLPDLGSSTDLSGYSKDELVAWAVKNAYADWAEGLSADELRGVYGYSSSGYKNLNRDLREGKALTDTDAKPTLMGSRSIDHNLQKAFGKAPALRQDTVVYRKGALPPDLKPGDTFVDPGYVSTSMDNFGLDAEAYSYRINVPAGTQTILPDMARTSRAWHVDVEGLNPVTWDGYNIGMEQEMLLNKGSTFRFEGVDENGMRQLELVPAEPAEPVIAGKVPAANIPSLPAPEGGFDLSDFIDLEATTLGNDLKVGDYTVHSGEVVRVTSNSLDQPLGNIEIHEVKAISAKGHSVRLMPLNHYPVISGEPDAALFQRAVPESFVQQQTFDSEARKEFFAYQDEGARANDALRNGESLSLSDQRMVDALDAAIAGSQTSEDILLTRYSDGALFGGEPSVGQTLSDKGFVSTSRDPELFRDIATENAADMADLTGEPASKVYEMRIEVPSGSHAFDISANSDDKAFASMQEVVLPRNSTFTVKSVDGNVVTIRLEPPAEPVIAGKVPAANIPSKPYTVQMDSSGVYTTQIGESQVKLLFQPGSFTSPGLEAMRADKIGSELAKLSSAQLDKITRVVTTKGKSQGDAIYAEKYGIKDFHAVADYQPGSGSVTFYQGKFSSGALQHEAGHAIGGEGSLDLSQFSAGDQAWIPKRWDSPYVSGPIDPNEWVDAALNDMAQQTSEQMDLAKQIKSQGPLFTPRVGQAAIDDYANSSLAEEWAESVRLYRSGIQLKDGSTAPFSKLYPRRAEILKKLLGPEEITPKIEVTLEQALKIQSQNTLTLGDLNKAIEAEKQAAKESALEKSTAGLHSEAVPLSPTPPDVGQPPIELQTPPVPTETPSAASTADIPQYGAISVTGPAGDTTTGGVFGTDVHGVKVIAKAYGGDQSRVASELLANRVYQELGVNTADGGLATVNGVRAFASPLLPGSSISKDALTIADKQKLGDSYMYHAYLNNRDFLGNYGNNVLWEAGEPAYIDQGGALEYKGLEGKKPFTADSVPEVETLLTKGQAKGMVEVSDLQKAQQAAHIAQTLTDQKIHQLVEQAGFPSKSEAAKLEKALIGRRDWMAKYAEDHGISVEPVQTAPPGMVRAEKLDQIDAPLYDINGEYVGKYEGFDLATDTYQVDGPEGPVSVHGKALFAKPLPEPVAAEAGPAFKPGDHVYYKGMHYQVVTVTDQKVTIQYFDSHPLPGEPQLVGKLKSVKAENLTKIDEIVPTGAPVEAAPAQFASKQEMYATLQDMVDQGQITSAQAHKVTDAYWDGYSSGMEPDALKAAEKELASLSSQGVPKFNVGDMITVSGEPLTVVDQKGLFLTVQDGTGTVFEIEADDPTIEGALDEGTMGLHGDQPYDTLQVGDKVQLPPSFPGDLTPPLETVTQILNEDALTDKGSIIPIKSTHLKVEPASDASDLQPGDLVKLPNSTTWGDQQWQIDSAEGDKIKAHYVGGPLDGKPAFFDTGGDLVKVEQVALPPGLGGTPEDKAAWNALKKGDKVQYIDGDVETITGEKSAGGGWLTDKQSVLFPVDMGEIKVMPQIPSDLVEVKYAGAVPKDDLPMIYDESGQILGQMQGYDASGQVAYLDQSGNLKFYQVSGPTAKNLYMKANYLGQLSIPTLEEVVGKEAAGQLVTIPGEAAADIKVGDLVKPVDMPDGTQFKINSGAEFKVESHSPLTVTSMETGNTTTLPEAWPAKEVTKLPVQEALDAAEPAAPAAPAHVAGVNSVKAELFAEQIPNIEAANAEGWPPEKWTKLKSYVDYAQKMGHNVLITSDSEGNLLGVARWKPDQKGHIFKISALTMDAENREAMLGDMIKLAQKQGKDTLDLTETAGHSGWITKADDNSAWLENVGFIKAGKDYVAGIEHLNFEAPLTKGEPLVKAPKPSEVWQAKDFHLPDNMDTHEWGPNIIGSPSVVKKMDSYITYAEKMKHNLLVSRNGDGQIIGVARYKPLQKGDTLRVDMLPMTLYNRDQMLKDAEQLAHENGKQKLELVNTGQSSGWVAKTSDNQQWLHDQGYDSPDGKVWTHELGEPPPDLTIQPPAPVKPKVSADEMAQQQLAQQVEAYGGSVSSAANQDSLNNIKLGLSNKKWADKGKSWLSAQGEGTNILVVNSPEGSPVGLAKLAVPNSSNKSVYTLQLVTDPKDPAALLATVRQAALFAQKDGKGLGLIWDDPAQKAAVEKIGFHPPPPPYAHDYQAEFRQLTADEVKKVAQGESLPPYVFVEPPPPPPKFVPNVSGLTDRPAQDWVYKTGQERDYRASKFSKWKQRDTYYLQQEGVDSAFSRYTGSWAFSVNQQLRAGVALSSRDLADVARMDRALARVEPAPPDTVTWRYQGSLGGFNDYYSAAGGSGTDKKIRALQAYVRDHFDVGDEINTKNSFWSASVNPENSYSSGPGRLLFEIKTKKAAMIQGVSGISSENEVLFARDSKFVVRGWDTVKTYKGSTVVVVQIEQIDETTALASKLDLAEGATVAPVDTTVSEDIVTSAKVDGQQIAINAPSELQQQIQQHLESFPGNLQHLKKVTLEQGANTEDEALASKYGVKGMKSKAAYDPASGVVSFYQGQFDSGTLNHELGHAMGGEGQVFDPYIPGGWNGVYTGGPINGDEWVLAARKDATSWQSGPTVVSKLAPSAGSTPVSLGSVAINEYAQTMISEDWAESIRLYLADQRDGYLFEDSNGHQYRFADVFAERAKILGDVFSKKLVGQVGEVDTGQLAQISELIKLTMIEGGVDVGSTAAELVHILHSSHLVDVGKEMRDAEKIIEGSKQYNELAKHQLDVLVHANEQLTKVREAVSTAREQMQQAAELPEPPEQDGDTTKAIADAEFIRHPLPTLLSILQAALIRNSQKLQLTGFPDTKLLERLGMTSSDGGKTWVGNPVHMIDVWSNNEAAIRSLVGSVSPAQFVQL